MIVAGDIGGTKTVIGLFEQADKGLCLVRDATFSSKDYSSLEQILAAFLQAESVPPLQVGCFGIAGPVISGRSKTTNLPWSLDEAALAKAIGVRRVKLLNDLEAAAYGMLHLTPDEFCVLNQGAQPHQPGNVAVIAAGTGLGEAMLLWDGEKHHPIASEGGHTGFAPRGDEQIGLLQYLAEKYGTHVSYERVLSGPGLLELYTFLRKSSGEQEPQWLTERLRHGDASATITQAGLAGEDPVCVRTIEMFASIYGAEAGNLALKCLAVGGAFIGGGIAPKMLPALQKNNFMRNFVDKGRFSDLMRGMPVKVALNPRAPLIGAAYYAARL